MAKSQKNSFIVVPNNDEQLKWLQDVLSDEGEVVKADVKSTERIGQLLDLTGAQIVFVGLSEENLRTNTAFIEDLLSFKTMLLIIAVADETESDLILSAVRSGAREFITTGTRQSEVMRLVHRLQSRVPVSQNQNNFKGKVISLISARPGTDSPMLALHLALALQLDLPDSKVLMLDLGTPAADTMTYLGITAAYSFLDAVHSLRRLDSTLIDTAFAKHESGLKLLALPEEHTGMGQLTSADIYVLLGVLQQHFSHIIVNLGGVPYSDFLHLMVNNSSKTLALLEQSVPSCKQNMQLIRKLSQAQVDMSNVSLVVDHYLPNLPPDAENLARGLNIELLTTLPSSGMARLKMMNSGESLYECAPRDPYTLAVRKVAKKLVSFDSVFEPGSKEQSVIGKLYSFVNKKLRIAQ
jgi:pilus assembly protein CpaE